MADELTVCLEGNVAGLITRDARGGLHFTYDEAYRTARGSTPLSLSMPKHLREHSETIAGPWFDNLLPDDDEVRHRWATDFAIGSPSTFNLLEYMGADCAGAVQVLPVGSTPDRSGTHEQVTPQDIEARLRALRRDGTSWNADDHGGRWSLGGAQGKFALARRADGTWAVPTGRAASTHILKVGVARFANADVAEFVTMRAARLLGLSVADASISRFGSQTALVLERYDRVTTDTATRRFHQEDLCQALGHWRHTKYQNDGGPGVEAVVGLLTDLHPHDVAASRELFARALVFNWLTAGVDAHAKNYSLLLAGDRARLAPLYDLTAGPLLLDPERVHYKGKTAMKIGGEYRLRNISRTDLDCCAATLGIDQDWFMSVAEDYATRIPDTFDQATDEAIEAGQDLVLEGTKSRYARGIRSHVTKAAANAGLG